MSNFYIRIMEFGYATNIVRLEIGRWDGEPVGTPVDTRDFFWSPQLLDESIAAEASEVVSAIDWTATSAGGRYLSGSDGAPVAIPPQPSEHHTFNWTTKQWEDPRTLQDFKETQWATIKQAREAAINAPLVTPYGTFDSDPKSRQNITDAILLLKSLEDLGSPGTIDFTLADDTARTLNTSEMVMVGLLLGQKIQAAHAQARALRGALDLATTKEEVEAITWQVTT